MRHTFLLTLFSCFFITFTSAQDLTKSRVAFVSFSGNVSSSLLDGLDSYEPQTDREKELERRVSNRLEKMYQDKVFELLLAKLEKKGIKMLPLEVSNNVAKLNYRGYPNPISSKAVIKKKNKDFADYFLNVTISCDKPILGGLLGFKPEARVKIALHDASGQKLKTHDETIKATRPIKRTDFDEPWNNLIDEFDKLDWFYMPALVDMLMPTVELSIDQVLQSL